MRSIFLAMALALPVALFGTSNASAAPVSGSALIEAAETGSIVEEAQWSRRRCGWVTRRAHRGYSRVRVVRVYRCWHRGRWR
jgi:hypothetical protein